MDKKAGPILKRAKRRIIVTGGAGYLGSVLIPKLLEKDYCVTVFDKFYFGTESLSAFKENKRLSLIEGDILNHENVPDLFKESDKVVHLAGISNDPSCDLNPNLTIQTNYLATISLARRAKAEGVKKLVFASSCSVYGAQKDVLLDENSSTGPVTLYALTKLQCENGLGNLVDKNFSLINLRFATLFGYSPRMRFDLAVNGMTKRALQGMDIKLNGEGNQYRPFLHVMDAARSIICALELEKNQNEEKQVFNVGNEGSNYRIKDLVALIQSEFSDIGVEHFPENVDVRSYKVKFDRAKEVLGFSTMYDVIHGVREIRKAYLEGRFGKNIDEDRFYNTSVMKKFISQPVEDELFRGDLWATDNPLIQSI